MASPSNPARLGALQLLDELGVGGMGRVLRAHDPATGREVAVKLGLQSLNPVRHARFLREVELAGAVSHPHLVTVHGGGLAEDGRPYLVMELVAGANTLESALGRVPRETALDLLAQVAEAVGALHRAGVVHRDVKETNVLVDELGQAKLCDLGLGWHAKADRLTRTGAALGTPSHMAPEQFEARGDPVPSTDVWSLGVILYRVLTGRLPYEASSLPELIAQVCAGPPVAPRRVAPDVPWSLDALCLRALSQHPAQRPPDGDAFAAALAEARAQPGRRRRLGPAVAALAVLGALGALAGALAPSSPAPSSTPPSPALGSTPPSPALGSTTPPPEVPRVASAPEPSPSSSSSFAAQLATVREAERLGFVWRWLRRHPQHPDRADALADLAARMHTGPLWTDRSLNTTRSALIHGDEVVVGSARGLCRFALDDGEPIDHWQFRHPAHALLALPGGDLLATVGPRIVRRTWPLDREGRRWSAQARVGGGSGVYHVALGRRRETVAFSAAESGPICLVATADGARTHDPIPYAGEVLALALSPDEQAVCVLGRPANAPTRTTVRRWSLAETQPQPLGEVTLHSARPGLAYSPDGETLAVSVGDGVQLLDGATLAKRQHIETLDGTVDGRNTPGLIAFSPDGQRLIAACGLVEGLAHTLRVIDLTQGALAGPPRPLPQRARGLSLSPDGSLVALALTSAVHVWVVGLPQDPEAGSRR